MSVISGFLETLILLGALQGFILSGMLRFHKPLIQSSRLLAVLLFLMSLASLNLYIQDSSWFSRVPLLGFLLNFIPMVIVMPMGPLIYFYVRTRSDQSFRFNKKYRIHFYPVIIDLIPHLTAFIYIIGIVTRWIPKNDAPWGNFIDQYNVYSDIPRWLSLSTYIWLSKRYLNSVKKITEPGSKEIESAYPWLNQILNLFSVFQVIWLIYLIPYCIPKYSDKLMDLVGWYPVYIPMSILIYWLGIKGYGSATAQRISNAPKNRATVPASLSRPVVDRLLKAMEEEKFFLDPALSLSLLAKHTGIPAKTISAVLNQHLHKTFNEFINEYRIRAVKERLRASADKNLTIAGLAYECGFNSQPTFQRAFKSIEGESPSEFLAKVDLTS
jgi:AraC-like DNA-binding protein